MTLRSEHDFWNIKSFQEAVALASKVTAKTGNLHMAYDYGSNVTPRYGILQPPCMGDDVSYGFNGDYYPDGKVKTVSANYRVITTTGGHKYYRHKQTPTWKMAGGTWSLVKGVHDERNPSF